jgi:hypothetical protein
LPAFHREVSSIVEELVPHDSELPTSWSDGNLIRDPALGQSPAHIRQILKDSLPSREVSRQLVDIFLNYQNSIFHAYTKDEVHAQLSLMYKEPALVNLAWFARYS